MVELCGIEPQSENGPPKASTCLETLFESRTASHNVQSYTAPASKFVRGRDIPRIYLSEGYTSQIFVDRIGRRSSPKLS